MKCRMCLKENTAVGFIVRDNEHNKLLNRKNCVKRVGVLSLHSLFPSCKFYVNFILF